MRLRIDRVVLAALNVRLDITSRHQPEKKRPRKSVAEMFGGLTIPKTD
jgi:hypothetical protein